jgi:hypothetical protein
MSKEIKTRLVVAGTGILVSLALFGGLALSLDGGPSPTPGDWSLLLLIPCVILNPAWFVLTLAGISWDLPEWVFWIILPPSSLWWWWYIGGVAARKLRRAQA